MAIILRNQWREYAVIQEVPKCASDYIARLLEHNHIPFLQTHIPKLYNPVCDGWQYEVMGDRSSHCIPCSDELYQKSQRHNRICFVRHPLAWLMSWWKFKIEWGFVKPARGWRDSSPFDQKCKSMDFSTFIDNYLEHYPNGLVKHFFDVYMSESRQWGRTENLKGDLQYFIQEQLGRGLKFDLEKCNTTRDYGLRYTREQADGVLERERELVELYERVGMREPEGYVE
jgi:hypothetical protein